jgi:hypothetical protein
MRAGHWAAAVAVVVWAGAAQAQVYWVGASWGTSWEMAPASAPDTNLLHSSDGAPALFAALPLNEDTLMRVRVGDLPHAALYGGMGWPGRLRSYTIGVDYLFRSVFGQTLLSGGFGSYDLYLKARTPPPGVEGSRFGWYLGVSEWLILTRRTRLTLELTGHQTQHDGHPKFLAFNVGLAFGL